MTYLAEFQKNFKQFLEEKKNRIHTIQTISSDEIPYLSSWINLIFLNDIIAKTMYFCREFPRASNSSMDSYKDSSNGLFQNYYSNYFKSLAQHFYLEFSRNYNRDASRDTFWKTSSDSKTVFTDVPPTIYFGDPLANTFFLWINQKKSWVSIFF